MRVTAILCITADSNNLPPLLIFKGKRGKTVEEKLDNVKSKKIYIFCQNNSWNKKEIMEFWLLNILKNIFYHKN